MKNYFLLFTILLFSNYVASQKINEKEIVGKWKVIKILKKIDNPNLKDIEKSFAAAVFEFKENSNFKLTTSTNTKLFTMVTNMTNISKWKLNTNNFIINIGTEADGYSIAKIVIIEVNDKIIFHMSETELDLEVQKE